MSNNVKSTLRTLMCQTVTFSNNSSILCYNCNAAISYTAVERRYVVVKELLSFFSSIVAGIIANAVSKRLERRR